MKWDKEKIGVENKEKQEVRHEILYKASDLVVSFIAGKTKEETLKVSCKSHRNHGKQEQ